MNFRRIITALALLAFCVGMASAQVGSSGAGTSANTICTANAATTPQLRSEGMTELIGDIVITCTGGSPLSPGTTVPTMNITVSLGTQMTSRLIATGAFTSVAEAVLFIDEPNTVGTGSSGLGPTYGFTLCNNPLIGAGPGTAGGLGGCVQVVSSGGVGNPPIGQSQTVTPATVIPASTAAANMFQGYYDSARTNQVTFNGVPINPPVTAGTARVFRITNVRANASAFGGGGFAGTTQLLASVSFNGSSAPQLTNPVMVAGFIQAGLTTGLRNTANTGGGSNTNQNQCGGGTTPLSVLRYTENFATAFKTRVAPTATYNGQSSFPTAQSTPGGIYNSESGLITTISGTAGLADYGTRLKAVFNNVPAGVRIFVSTSNVLNDFSALPAQPAGNSVTAYAQLVLSETATDSNGFPPLASANSTVSFSVTLNIWEVPIVNGTGTAVWEVINANPNGFDSLDFAVYSSFTANPGANSPPPGTATVNQSYAPTPTAAFTAAAGSQASGSLTIPRFADTSTSNNLTTIVLCQTALLFPFVTNIAGFDTGLAIANTTTDPFGTRTQNGACTLNFYGTAAPAAVNTGNVPTATVYTTLTSTAAPGFNGYMIAVCNFQLAHGFAFVSDLGARQLAMGYLALVIETGTGNRNNINERLNN